METKKFIKNFNLHDSLLEKIEYHEEKGILILTLDFCCWQQAYYNDDMPETMTVLLLFTGVTEFKNTNYNMNSDEIIKVSHTKQDTIKITLFNDFANAYYEIAIKATDVKIYPLKTDSKGIYYV